MGVVQSDTQPGPTEGDDGQVGAHDARLALGVALQVAFERQTLKPVFHLIGYGFERL
jgi:hypothetical protein